VGVDLIFCAGRTRRYAEIALAAGFLYGCRSDYRPLFPVHFADLNWKAPDLDAHLAFVREQRPRIAVAPDVLAEDDLPAALRYAERLAAHAPAVVVVPKVQGLLLRLPREPWLRVGYSVPTAYGSRGPTLDLEYAGWPVHLLGGSPRAQLRLAARLAVASADGNSLMKAARFGTFWDGRGWNGGGGGRGVPPGPGQPYRAFARSCAAVAATWAPW
jgi:hypothetical protein